MILDLQVKLYHFKTCGNCYRRFFITWSVRMSLCLSVCHKVRVLYLIELMILRSSINGIVFILVFRFSSYNMGQGECRLSALLSIFIFLDKFEITLHDYHFSKHFVISALSSKSKFATVNLCFSTR